MSKNSRHGGQKEGDTESDPLSDCKSSVHPTTHKTDPNIGPSGDYQFTVQPTYMVRSIMKESSRDSSGGSLDEDLYGFNDDYLVKLNLVRRKLNLIEITDDSMEPEKQEPICARTSTPLESRDSTAHSSSSDDRSSTSSKDSKGSVINQYYNVYQLNYINQSVSITTNARTEADTYYELSSTELKKKGTKGWSVDLQDNTELNTIFEVSSNLERDSSLSDYLQLTYNPPKKKICRRAKTPVLSPVPGEHIELPYRIKVGMDKSLLQINSRHYLETRSTQYSGADTLDGDANHSIMDIDKKIDETQIEVYEESEKDFDDVSPKLEEENVSVNETEGQAQKYVHLIPEVTVRVYGSESRSASISPCSFEDSDLVRFNSRPASRNAASLEIDGPENFHLDLETPSEKSSVSPSAKCSCHYHESEESDESEDDDQRDDSKSSPMSFVPLNVPLEDSSIDSSNTVSPRTTTVIELKSKSAFFNRITLRNRGRVSDSCMTLETSKTPSKKRKTKKGFLTSRTSESTSGGESPKKRSKTARPITLTRSGSEDPLIDNLVTISPLVTTGLDVPRLYITRYKFPPIAYFTSCFGQRRLNTVNTDRLIPLKQKDVDKWWDKTMKKHVIIDSDSYKDIAKRMLETNVCKEVARKKETSTMSLEQKLKLTENHYNLRKKQSQEITFYSLSPTLRPEDENDPKRESKVDVIDATKPCVHERQIRASKSMEAQEETTDSSDSDSETEDAHSCWSCVCLRKIFANKEVQFFA